ncbi:MAG TPA: AraC family transcriptional regulator [Polyangiaceae bacterium]|nr:AraC family transcriptional regulator [Polyangiaceae bacterium]
MTKGTFDGDTISAMLFRFVLDAASGAGLDRDELLALTGVRAEDLEGQDARVPRASQHKLWDELSRRTGDECVGLRLADGARRPGVFGVLDYLVRSSSDLGEALDQLARFLPLLFVGDTVIDERTEREVLFGYRRGAYRFTPSRHAAECNVAALLYVGRQLVGTDWSPLEVLFEHAAPPDLREHRRVFRAPLRFGAPVNGMRFERALLDRPAVRPDPGLSAVLGHLAERMLLEIAHEPPITGQVRRFLLEAYRAGAEPSLEAAARALRMTPRSLQRKLAAEGGSHRDLLDQVRRALALAYLRDDGRSVTEVAELLGFSDPSTFHRAFRRWTGHAPHEYRDKRT